jgi:hypothetical protein
MPESTDGVVWATAFADSAILSGFRAVRKRRQHLASERPPYFSHSGLEQRAVTDEPEPVNTGLEGLEGICDPLEKRGGLK